MTRKRVWLQSLETQGMVHNGIAWRFFTSGDSREPELAGIRGALMGSILTLLVTLGLCLPIGVAAAIYLEEFAPKNRLTDLIEVNINNLAAVPSIVFGLLGLAMFLNFFGLPRSAPLGRRPGAGASGAAHHHHRIARGAQGRAAVDQGSSPRRRRLQAAGDLPSYPAARHARHHDRHHHRHGACAGRNRAIADDRHGRLHRRHSRPASPMPRPRCRCRSICGPTFPKSPSRRRRPPPSSFFSSSCSS